MPAYVRVVVFVTGGSIGSSEADELDQRLSTFEGEGGNEGREAVRSRPLAFSWEADGLPTDDSVLERASIRLASFVGDAGVEAGDNTASKIPDRSGVNFVLATLS